MTHKQTRKQLKTLYLVNQYKRAHDVNDVDPDVAAQWAYDNGLWKMVPVNPVRILRRLMTQALRSEYHEDPQNREVRKNHPGL